MNIGKKLERLRPFFRSRRISARRKPYAMRVETLESRRLLTAAVSEYGLRDTGGPSEYVTLGPDQDLWMTLSTNNIGQLNTTTGAINQYPIPTPNSSPAAIITGPDRNLWFIETATNQLAYVKPSTGVVTEVPILADGATQIQDLASGPDSNLWFTEFKADRIGMINPTSHAVEEFSIPTANAEPYDIVSADGDLWFTESGANKIGMINPTTHAFSEFAVTSSGNVQPEGITLGTDGNLWFTETGANAIGRFNPKTDAFASYNTGLSGGAGLSEITSGPDGNLWFTEANAGQIGTIAPGTSTIQQYSGTGSNLTPIGITSGSDGNLYFAQSNSSSQSGIGEVSTSGTFTQITLPTTSASAIPSMVEGNDGNLWFVNNTSSGLGQVGLISPGTNESVEYPVSAPTTIAEQIALDPTNGTLWFTEAGAQTKDPDKIGTISPTTRQLTEFTLPTKTALGIQGIAYDQSAFYFTEQTGNSIGTINLSNDVITDNLITLPTNSNPDSMVADSLGDLWFTEPGTNSVGEYNPITGHQAQVSLSGGSNPAGITLGPDGNIWFAEAGNGKVGVINPNSASLIDETAASATGSISSGPDGAVWFSQGGAIGRITTSTYQVSSFALTSATAEAVSSGPDGNLWFTGAGSGGTGSPNIAGTVDLSAAATATQLGIATQPVTLVTANKGFGFVATVENAAGAVDTYYEGPVTIAIGQNTGPSTLTGTATATAVNGVAVFPGLSLNQPASGYTMVASSPTLTSAITNPFTVSNTATHFVFTVQPPAIVSSTSKFSVTVTAEDALNNVDTSYNNPLSLAIGTNPGSSTLSGTTLLGANDGVVTFSGLSLNNVASGYTLIVSDPSNVLKSLTSTSFNITAATATHLVVTTEPPSGVVAGTPFGLVVEAEDSHGQVDLGDTNPVTLTLPNGNGATLGGTVTANLVQGVVTFSNLTLNLDGSGYIIHATSGSLTAGSTTAISVISAAASSLVMTPTVTGNPITGIPFSVKVSAFDPYGNPATSYAGTVRFSSSDPRFTPPADYTFQPSDLGSHVFPITLLTVGTESLTVTDDANPTITASTSVQVAPQTPTVTTLIASPTSAVAGQSVTLYATVSPDDATGTVTFYDGTTVLKVVPLTSTGAAIATSAFMLGTNSLRAVYSGSTDGTLASSPSTPVPLVVSKFTTSTTLVTTATSSGTTVVASLLGQSLTLTATVKPVSPGTITPTGIVTFLDGTTTLGMATLNATGQASLVIPKLALGTHSITVSYPGDPNGLSGNSTATALYVGDIPDADYDGDGKSDLAVFGINPIYGKYGITVLTSSSGFKSTIFFDNNGYGYGNSQSIPVPGDYFGDGRQAYALWTPNNLGGMTFTAVSASGTKSITGYFGGVNELPVVADVDGDGKDDFGVYGYIPGYGYCFDFLLSSDNFNINQQYLFNNNGYGYGDAQSIPVVGDFDGSGKAGYGVYTPSGTGSTFAFVDPSRNYGIVKTIAPSQGTVNDIPMAVDYNGSGTASLALYGPSPANLNEYRYLILTASSGFNPSQAVIFNNNGYGYGNSYSVPVMADYNGTGKFDYAVFTPDFEGGEEYVFQNNQTGAGVIEDFATLTEIPLSAPTYLIAKKVRGQ